MTKGSMRRSFPARSLFMAIFCAAVLAASSVARSQAIDLPRLQPASRVAVAALPDAPQPRSADGNAVTVRNTPRHILDDQKAIWTSPVHIHKRDMIWLLPLAAATGVALATDHHTMKDVVSHDATFDHDNVDASNALLTVLVAVPVVDFGYGEIANDDHDREAGILGGESLVDSAVIEQGMKLIFWRERPGVDNANGHFWQSSVGLDSSFPSSHSVFAWSTAAIIAGEHPSFWSQAAVYTLATGVSLTRVLGQEHFPTDVLVGSAAGWLAGHYVYKVRHRWRRHSSTR